MRALRPLCLVLLVVVGLTTLTLGEPMARAQSVEETEQEAEEAEQRAEAAAGLVDSAVAERAAIEGELVVSIARINDLAEQLSIVSSNLDSLAGQIAFADSELSGITAEVESHAVDAYMDALAGPGVAFVNSSNVEQAMVAGQVVDEVVSSGTNRANQLATRRVALEELRADYQVEQERVAALQAEVDAEIEHLAALYDRADAKVGQAVRDAAAADAAYREALGAVDAAQAREAERERQAERPPPTILPEPEPEPEPTPTTPAPPETTGDREFPPAVERWRSLAAAYFPAARVDEALAILGCESLGDPDAYNPYSGASGLFQFLPSTWASTSPKAGFEGASPFDPEANMGTAAWLGQRYNELGKGYWAPWSCRRVL